MDKSLPELVWIRAATKGIAFLAGLAKDPPGPFEHAELPTCQISQPQLGKRMRLLAIGKLAAAASPIELLNGTHPSSSLNSIISFICTWVLLPGRQGDCSDRQGPTSAGFGRALYAK